MATEQLYLHSIEAGYYTNFGATVTSVETDKVTLDRTLFYPLGGGQNWDTGTLEGPNGLLNVLEVRGRGNILHSLDTNHQLEVGDEVKGSVDWQRRHAHMRMHTAQHIVSGVVYETFNGARTVGNQIHHDRSRIDFNPISFTEEMLEQISQTVNQLIDENHKVTDSTMTREEVNAEMPPDRTNMNLLPASVKQLRVVKIGDNIDLCPCAGTHVRELSEIGHMKITGKKSKGKGTQRITYELQIPQITPQPIQERL